MYDLLALIALLWGIPVIITTMTVHLFVNFWRKLKMKSYAALGIIWISLILLTFNFRNFLLVSIDLPYWSVYLGAISFSFGLSFLFWSYKTLTPKMLMWFAEIKRDKKAKIVAKGPYGFVRHPIYFASIINAISVFLITGVISIPPIIILILLLALIEERELRKRFGKSHSEYSKKVPMIFPIKF